MDMQKYKGLFLKEAEEHIDHLDRVLEQIEQGGVEPDIIHSIFRDVHSIKGMSASMGYNEIKFLSHKLENFLDCIRKEELTFTDEAVECFANSVDFLGNLIREVKQDQLELSSPIEIIEEIERIITNKGQKKNKLQPSTPSP